MVDFSNDKQTAAWFKEQTVEVRCVMASRAALRVAANVGLFEWEGKEWIALSALRAMLTSAGRGLGRPADVDALEGAARSAAFAADTAAFAARSAEPTYSAADSATFSAALAAARSAEPAYSFAESGIFYAVRSSASAIRPVVFPSASASADTAALRDSDALGKDAAELFNRAAWAGVDIPDTIAANHAAFLAWLGQDKRWDFWRRWYLDMWEGRFAEWDLAIEVAKIPDDVWKGEDALTKVAEAIRVIEEERSDQFDRPDSVPEIERNKLIEHVRRLLAAPEMTALAAEGTAALLDQAIDRYLKDAPANCLPDAMAHLHHVPKLFRAIAATTKSGEQSEAKVQRMTEQIAALNSQIAKLEADLLEARAKTVNGLFTQSAIKAAGGAFGAGLVGSFGLGIAHFFGQWPGDLTLENMRGFLDDLSTATPKPDAVPTLPPDIET